MKIEDELSQGTLTCIGIGIEKEVFGTKNYVVKLNRSWRVRMAHSLEHFVVRRFIDRLPWVKTRITREHKIGKFLIGFFRVVLWPIPKSALKHWGVTRYYFNLVENSASIEILANKILADTEVILKPISINPTKVRLQGRWLPRTVIEVFQRVDLTLFSYYKFAVRKRDFSAVEALVDQWLDLHKEIWSHGLFYTSMSFRRYGVADNKIVIIDNGDFTSNLKEIQLAINKRQKNAWRKLHQTMRNDFGKEAADPLIERMVSGIEFSRVMEVWPDK